MTAAQRRRPEDWIPDVLVAHGATRLADLSLADLVAYTPGRSDIQARALSIGARVAVRMGLPGAAAPGTETRDRATLTETPDGLRMEAHGRVTSLDDLLVGARVDLSTWTPRKWSAGTYETTARDEHGALRTIPMWRVRADFDRRIDADLPDLSTLPAAPRATSEAVDDDLMLCVPDSQHGYARDDDGRLHPLHDPRARGHVDTTGPALAALHADIRALREACPGARIIYTAGNHEDRIDRALVAQLSELAGLRAVGDDAPLVSVARLLALDRLDVEYVGPYDTDHWHRGVRLTHGSKHGRPGATVAAILADVALGGHPTVVGHTHSVEVAYQRLVDARGARVVCAMSAGTVCRVDGDIPAFVTADRRNWSQGLGVVRWSGDHVAMTAAPILPDGTCYIEGQRVAA